ncbi:S-layer homology domain-containing protein [Paenibacillus sp. D9]|uniref:S-layer homology domain-containing protein n=1 Tax=Paenibacillus sp. D9 TaxID=665792 RepID=UPI000675EB56|nr:S-layer homology domain-containing protein [Paenibacillus sp. D9]
MRISRELRRWIAKSLAVLMVISLAVPTGWIGRAAAADAVTLAYWAGTGSGAGSSAVIPVTSGLPQNTSALQLSGATITGFSGGPTGISGVVSANAWSGPGAYWEAALQTTGYSNISVSSLQRGSGTGPRDFKLQYSLDKTAWNDVAQGDVVVANNWTQGVLNGVPLPSSADNQSQLYLRWTLATNASVGGATIGAAGTSQIAAVSVTGTPIGSGGNPGVPVTAAPSASGISLTDAGILTGAPGSVPVTSYVYVYYNEAASTPQIKLQAAGDGSFGTAVDTADGKSKVWVTAQESGKQESAKTAVSVAKSATPDAAKLIFANPTTLTGAAGSVAGGSAVTAAFEDGTQAGTATAGQDGSFAMTLSNPSSKTKVLVAAKEQGKLKSDAATAVIQGSGGALGYKPGDVVISQAYLNGGNSGAFYKTKFFELYNTTDKDINFNNQWALMYGGSSSTAFGTITKLTGIIKAHGYYLVAGNTGTAGAALPVDADQTSSLNPSGSTGGILALAQKTTAVSGDTDNDLVDLLAYGNGTTTSFNIKTPNWGSPFFTSNVGSGTVLRKTDAGSDPRSAIGLGNGYWTRNNANDFVMNVPNSTAAPEEISVRNSKWMAAPDASKLTLSASSVQGTAGSVPAAAAVSVYALNGSDLAAAGQATSAADGSFTVSLPSPASTVYVAFAGAGSSSAYTRLDSADQSAAVLPIGTARTVDAKGLPLHIGYRTTIQGTVTTANKALGSENTSFYIQDATGGINVIGKDTPAFPIVPGQKVKLSGYLVFAAGTSAFVPVSMTDQGSGTLPGAELVRSSDLGSFAAAEPLEGKLVRIKAKVSNIPATGPDYNVTVVDGEGNASIVRILAQSGIDMTGTTVELGETYSFTGIVGQSKAGSPYTSGYYLMPRSAADVRGDLQLQHTPLLKAYTGVDVTFKASAKYAESVTVFYRAAEGQAFTPVQLNSADGLNYNGRIAKENVPPNSFQYYMEAAGGGDTTSAGSADKPYTVEVGTDTDGPAFFNPVPGENEEVETMHPIVSVELEDPNGVDLSSLTIAIDGKDLTAKAALTEGSIKLALTPDDDLAQGVHEVRVTAKDKLGNPSDASWSFRVAERFTGGNHYYGTTHNHTNISHDAAGTPEDALKAAEKYGYDFFAFSDHSHDIDASQVGKDTVDHNGMPERTGGSDWQLTKDLATQYTKDGQFVVFPAFEMTATTWGHSNVFGTTNFIDRVVSGGKYQSLQNYYAWIVSYDDIVAQFNHPAMGSNAFNNFIPYDKKVDKLFTMLEVGNGSGNYSYANAENKFFSALDIGWHVAPTYGEDNHDATWGQTKQRTVIVSKDLSQESLLDAMKKMRVYFTEDPSAKLDVSASGWYMGSTTDTKTLNFDIKVSDPLLEKKEDPKFSYLKSQSNDNIAKIELVTNGGRVLETYTPTSDTTDYNWKPKTINVVGGQQWFVVRVTQKDGDRIYSSPIWTPVEPVAVKVNSVSTTDGAIIGGYAANLQAGISNLGTVDVKNITAKFYYDQADAAHLIGEAGIDSLAANASTTASVVWSNPVAGEHKIIVVLSSTDRDLGENKYEQIFSIKAPLGKTILIDASKNNENTTKDAGTYKDNMKLFSVKMRQQGYTVAENAAAITDEVLKDAAVLYISHPASAYSSSEIAAINRYVSGGGSVWLSEKSNYGGSNQNLNDVLAGISSAVRVNNDGVFDETPEGNFWSNPLTSNFSVRAHPAPVSNYLTDFISTLDYYSGSSLAKAGKEALTDGNGVTVLVRGNETTFQDTSSIKSDTVIYNQRTSNGKNGPALADVTGGSSIPLIASEQLGKGRVVVSGMNVFNDKQMDETYNAKGNAPLSVSVMNWLAGLETKAIPIGAARTLPEETPIMVEGTVTTAAGVFFDAFYVQDATGGIMAFNDVPAGSLAVGDKVRVYGHVKIFENNTELEFGTFAQSVVKVSSGVPLEPKAVGTAESVSDSYQGQLVKVTGKVLSKPDANSFIIDDGSGPVLVFVDGYIATQSGPVPDLAPGDILEAAGLSGRYAEGDRIRVRDTKELKKAESVPLVEIHFANPGLKIRAGETGKLAVNFVPVQATNKELQWSSADETIATVTYGVVTGLKAGKVAISALSVDSGLSAVTEVEIVQPVTSITLEPSVLELTEGETATLHAIIAPADASNQGVSWTSSNNLVAEVNDGVVQARKAGEATVTATTYDGGFKATAMIKVNAATTEPPTTEPPTTEPPTTEPPTTEPPTTEPPTTEPPTTEPPTTEPPTTEPPTTEPPATQTPTPTAKPTPAPEETPTPSATPTPKPTATPTTAPTATPAPTASPSGIIVVKPEQLASGTAAVQVASDTTEIRLPADSSSKLKAEGLTIEGAGHAFELVIPAELLKQLESKIKASDSQTAYLSLKMNKLSGSEAAALAAKAGVNSAADVKALSDMYEFTLSAWTANGEAAVLSSFNVPVTLRFKLPATDGSKLYGIYYVADDGRLEYIGGKTENGEITAQIKHFSKYAVLEVKKSFADVAPSYWAHDLIAELAAKGIVKGTSSSAFEPKRSITRAEFASLLVNALKLEATKETAFKDVSSSAWYADAVGKAYAAGIISGRSAAVFDPNGLITREEMVSMLIKAYEILHGAAAAPSPQAGAEFTDLAKVAPWAVIPVKQAASLGLIQGRSSGQFVPKGISTRAEAAQLLYNLMLK